MGKKLSFVLGVVAGAAVAYSLVNAWDKTRKTVTERALSSMDIPIQFVGMKGGPLHERQTGQTLPDSDRPITRSSNEEVEGEGGDFSFKGPYK